MVEATGAPRSVGALDDLDEQQRVGVVSRSRVVELAHRLSRAFNVLSASQKFSL